MHGSIVRTRSGYLLLEVVLALGLAGVILTVIFQMADGTLSLGKTIIDSGRADAKQEALLNFFERGFSEMPGNAVVELATTDTSERFLPRMIIQNAPTSFAFDGLPISAQAIVLTTVPSPKGVNVVLEYYEEPLLDSDDQEGDERQEPTSSLIVYRDIWRFEIRVLDSRTMEWVSDWDVRGRLPLQVELNAVFSEDDVEVVHHFWIPPKVSPATLVGNLGQGGGASTRNPNQNSGANQGGPDTNVSVPANPTQGGAP